MTKQRALLNTLHKHSRIHGNQAAEGVGELLKTIE